MKKDDREPTEHANINYFAIRCFRDTGDLDYVAARVLMKSHLSGPFLWSASQAVEKYLKCILILHRINTKDISHNLTKALTRIRELLPFRIELEEGEQELFNHLAQWNGDRYLLTSFTIDSYELLQLDSLVWKLRQYCVPLNKRHYSEEPSDDVLRERVREVEDTIKGESKIRGHLKGAVLESILLNKDHASHDALTWQNMFYSRTERKTIRYRSWSYAVNAPLFLQPELGDKICKWMKIHDTALDAARELAARRAAKKRSAC